MSNISHLSVGASYIDRKKIKSTIQTQTLDTVKHTKVEAIEPLKPIKKCGIILKHEQ